MSKCTSPRNKRVVPHERSVEGITKYFKPLNELINQLVPTSLSSSSSKSSPSTTPTTPKTSSRTSTTPETSSSKTPTTSRTSSPTTPTTSGTSKVQSIHVNDVPANNTSESLISVVNTSSLLD
ncbi:unnamed protein product, partial [Rotaria sp. Silwood2]